MVLKAIRRLKLGVEVVLMVFWAVIVQSFMSTTILSTVAIGGYLLRAMKKNHGTFT